MPRNGVGNCIQIYQTRRVMPRNGRSRLRFGLTLQLGCGNRSAMKNFSPLGRQCLIVCSMLLVPLRSPRASIGPFGGSATLTAVDPANPSNVYAAAAEGGLYKSTDGGETWATADSGLGALWVLGIAIDPTWSEADSGLISRYIQALAVDSQNPQTLYAGTSAFSVWQSDNGAQSWH